MSPAFIQKVSVKTQKEKVKLIQAQNLFANGQDHFFKVAPKSETSKSLVGSISKNRKTL